MTPWQRAAEAKAKADKAAADALAEKNQKMRVLFTNLTEADIKKMMRNPDSVIFEKALANDDGSVVCLRYMAQNGFGGMNQGQASLVKDKIRIDNSVYWNKYCADQVMYDMGVPEKTQAE